MADRPPGATGHQRKSSATQLSPVSDRYARDRWDEFLSQDRQGVLHIEGVSVEEITKKYGTPLYVMVESDIRKRCRRFKKVFGRDIQLQYAAKVNSNLEILRIVREEGMELDCSSIGEVILGMLADFKPRQMTFTNLHKTEQDIHFAAKLGIQAITGDSYEDLEAIARTAKKLKKQIRVTIRVNPMLQIGNYSTKGNKYGIPINYVDHAIDIVAKSPYLDFYGFHFHGGYVHNSAIYKFAARSIVKLIKRCYNRGLKPRFLSLGGGFPAAIGDEHAFPIERMRGFSRYFDKLVDEQGIPRIELAFEPGKSIVLNAGMGLMRVISKKKLGRKRFVIADGSTYNFVPDALVQQDLKYDILPADKLKSPRIHRVVIAGNTCDCWDLITKDITMPKLRAGDLLAIMDVGAYAAVMASNFNTIRRASMIMIYSDGTTKLIRRRDRFSEMFAPELDVLKVDDPKELERYYNLYRVNVDRIWKGSGTKGKHNGKNGKNGMLTGLAKESVKKAQAHREKSKANG